MTIEKLPKEQLEVINKIKEEVSNPEMETKNLPLVVNSYVDKKNEIDIKQYKLSIPKKFMDIAKLNETNCKIKAILNKAENKIIIEITHE